MAARFDVDSVRGRWADVLAALGADEKTLSGKHCPCPFCGGKDRFRFTDNEGRGMWICNSCGSGNGMQFVQRLKGVDFVGAIHAVERVLPTAAARPVPTYRPPRDKLNAIWRRGRTATLDDPVGEYLANRGVWADGVSDLRYVAALPYYEGKELIGSYDAMVALVRDGNGVPTTLHVTYLRDGRKADVPAPKKVLSKMGEGAAIRLFGGAGDELAVTEGIETALAVRRRTGLPVWAAISANGMRNLALPGNVRRLLVCGDNDPGFVGQVAAYTLAQRARADGLEVYVDIPEEVGTDWADKVPAARRGG